MAQFKDAMGRDWTIFITTQEIRDLRTQLDVNLTDFADGDQKFIERIANDPVLLVDIISVLLSEQITKAGLDAKQFAQGLVGQGIDNAVDALIQGIADFSGPRKGAILRQLWTKHRQAQGLAMDRAEARISSFEIDKVVAQKVDQIFDEAEKKFGESSLKPPPSLASSPGPTPSEN